MTFVDALKRYGVSRMLKTVKHTDWLKQNDSTTKKSGKPAKILGDATNVYLASAELAAVASLLGRLPTVEEYMVYAAQIDTMAADVYRYLSFDQIAEFRESAAKAKIDVVAV